MFGCVCLNKHDNGCIYSFSISSFHSLQAQSHTRHRGADTEKKIPVTFPLRLHHCTLNRLYTHANTYNFCTSFNLSSSPNKYRCCAALTIIPNSHCCIALYIQRDSRLELCYKYICGMKHVHFTYRDELKAKALMGWEEGVGEGRMDIIYIACRKHVEKGFER